MRKYKNRRKEKINIPALIVISLILVLFFVLIYFFQANIFPLIPINGVIPNLFVIFILVIGLFGNNFLAIMFGVISRSFHRLNLWRSSWYNASYALLDRLCGNMV